MVIKTVSIMKPRVEAVRSVLAAPAAVGGGGGAARRERARRPAAPRRAPPAAPVAAQRRLSHEAESEAGDVIDLGAPRLQRRAAAPQRRKSARATRYQPNPRLYPGPQPKTKLRAKRTEARGNDTRGRRRKCVFRRCVPNARLYRPAPPRPPPPPAAPRASWPPPAPPARLDTASSAALRLSEQRRHSRVPSALSAPSAPSAPFAPPTRRLVVTLPAPSPHYRPASDHFRLRSLDTDSGASTPAAGRPAGRPPPPAAAPAMDTGNNRHSTSPEDFSDGNETLSAPSEFLAEFLSAIMRRQYAEALKYCRLILQYEPHNATARGFYPLLQHKLQAHKRAGEGVWARGSSSDDASAPAEQPHELMEQGADESDGSASGRASRSSSCASQSSLELDSSEAPVQSSPSLSLSQRTDSAGASAGCWDSTGSASRSEPDDNGNAPPPRAADLRNDNAPPPAAHKSESSASLRRLRAQFTCSIK